MSALVESGCQNLTWLTFAHDNVPGDRPHYMGSVAFGDGLFARVVCILVRIRSFSRCWRNNPKCRNKHSINLKRIFLKENLLKRKSSQKKIFSKGNLLKRKSSQKKIIWNRDGNSSENFIPRGIEESRNGKFTFLGDRGIWNLFLGVLGEFRGISYPKNH